MLKGLHTNTVLDNDLLQTVKRFIFSDKCQIRELAEAYNPRIPPTHNLNLFAFRRNFPVHLCMRSFEPLCGGRKIVKYGNSVRLLRIVVSLVN